MKKYSLKTKVNSHQISKIKIGAAALLLLLGLIVLLPPTISAVSSVLLYPLHVTRIWLVESSDSLPRYLQEKSELVAEINRLEQELSSRSGTRLSIERLQAENESLRSMLGSADTDRILSRVIARPNQLPYDVLQIDSGRQDGVKEGAPVFIEMDRVIGFVSYAAENYALVTLVTSPGQRATAYVFGPDMFATTEGVGGGVLRVRVPRGADLSLEDLVVLPGVTSGVLGKVIYIETEATQPQQYGYVSIGESLQSLKYVTVGASVVVPLSFSEAQSLVADIRNDIFRIDVPQSEFELENATSTESIATSTDSL